MVWRVPRAVVLESDDWGLCAWSPDDTAFQALADTPAYRSPAGKLYGRSTLEGAEDVRRLGAELQAVSGADGLPPVWQANTVMAAPDYARFDTGAAPSLDVPLVFAPQTPARWARPGLWDEVNGAMVRGLWWPELHGLLHVPLAAWRDALRRGQGDARAAFAQQVLVCAATQAGGEFDAREPGERREQQLAQAVRAFRDSFQRPPFSFCPPDYVFDAEVEPWCARHGIRVLQGWVEQAGGLVAGARRRWRALRWPRRRGLLLAMPARIALEPRGQADPAARLGAMEALRRIRGAWRMGRPAVVSTHRHNYAHLDPAWSEAGRSQLRWLLDALAREGATFLTDNEVFELWRSSWSLRPVGPRRELLRRRGRGDAPIEVVAPEGAARARVRAVRGGAEREFRRRGEVVAIGVESGDWWLEWAA
jgi:hypothetical protein